MLSPTSSAPSSPSARPTSGSVPSLARLRHPEPEPEHAVPAGRRRTSRDHGRRRHLRLV